MLLLGSLDSIPTTRCLWENEHVFFPTRTLWIPLTLFFYGQLKNLLFWIFLVEFIIVKFSLLQSTSFNLMSSLLTIWFILTSCASFYLIFFPKMLSTSKRWWNFAYIYSIQQSKRWVISSATLFYNKMEFWPSNHYYPNFWRRRNKISCTLNVMI